MKIIASSARGKGDGIAAGQDAVLADCLAMGNNSRFTELRCLLKNCRAVSNGSGITMVELPVSKGPRALTSFS